MAIGSIGLLHPGEMGAAVGGELASAGHRVFWASRGRRPPSRHRAEAAGLVDVETIDALVQASDVIISLCPPHAALDVAKGVSPFRGIYLDANAISPATARQVADIVEHAGGEYVDGCVIGSPPTRDRATRLYLAGKGGPTVLDFFAGTSVQAAVVSSDPVAASALKMSYAAWSKGSAALLLAVRALAAAEGVLEPLLAAWQASELDLGPRSLQAGEWAAKKGWRWAGEMDEVAATFRSAGLPDGFHRAAAEMFARASGEAGVPADDTLPPLSTEGS
jgi:3-hydroxyisobutyrate dehydrogenase-like beta-hydroxyacid dehydrogenase